MVFGLIKQRARETSISVSVLYTMCMCGYQNRWSPASLEKQNDLRFWGCARLIRSLSLLHSEPSLTWQYQFKTSEKQQNLFLLLNLTNKSFILHDAKELIKKHMKIKSLCVALLCVNTLSVCVCRKWPKLLFEIVIINTIRWSSKHTYTHMERETTI